MPINNNKIEQLHNALPKMFNSRNNVNWKALVEAIGESDSQTADLLEAVRNQFFVKTANRPYLDRLGANNQIARPKFVGMDDPTFREYIPVLSYQPKQVKFIIDSLLNIFFFKDATTAYVQTIEAAPFVLQDGWELEYNVDGIHVDRVIFKSEYFTNISAATAPEVVAVINRQSKYSFAISYYDSISKKTFIRIFSNTVGSKGSISMLGGRAIIGLKPDGFILNAGPGANTQWNGTKIGAEVSFQHIGGISPGIGFLKRGDIFISNISNNVGSYTIETVDIANNRFTFRNVFGTAGVYTQTSDIDSKFIRPTKFTVYKKDRHAATWEVEQGQIIVEMPCSPPVVKRSLKGSIHMNGPISIMANRDSDNSLTLENASDFPDSGTFELEEVNQMIIKILNGTENTTITQNINSRLIGTKRTYSYTGKSGNTLTGITPALPKAASLDDYALMSIISNGSVATATTSSPHNYQVGDKVIIGGSSGILASTTTGDLVAADYQILNVGSTAGIQIGSLVTGPGIQPDTVVIGILGDTVYINNGLGSTQSGAAISFYDNVNKEHTITAITPTTFSFLLAGTASSAPIPGESRKEQIGLANSGSKVILLNSRIDTKILGPYLWDTNAPFVLSSYTAPITNEIKVGRSVKTLEIGANDIPKNGGGFIVFDYGQRTQEGPVRFLYKANDNTLILDPSYVFQKHHDAGSAITLISKKGPHEISVDGREYPGYITDPAIAREQLQDLIKSVKSAGIFVEFLIRYPDNLYSTLDLYKIGIDPG